MAKQKKDVISNTKINQYRNNLMELFREYQSIDKFSNVYNRFKKNSNKKSMMRILIRFFISIARRRFGNGRKLAGWSTPRND